jgi:hypothetical protein
MFKTTIITTAAAIIIIIIIIIITLYSLGKWFVSRMYVLIPCIEEIVSLPIIIIIIIIIMYFGKTILLTFRLCVREFCLTRHQN